MTKPKSALARAKAKIADLEASLNDYRMSNDSLRADLAASQMKELETRVKLQGDLDEACRRIGRMVVLGGFPVMIDGKQRREVTTGSGPEGRAWSVIWTAPHDGFKQAT